MKKLVVTLCTLLMCISSFAGDIKVIEGKAAMNKREGLAEVVFVWDNAKYDNRHSLKEQWIDLLPSVVQSAALSTVNSSFHV